MIPKKFEHIVFGFLLSCLMSFIVSGVATLRAIGLVENFTSIWFGAWLSAWAIAFPAVLFAAPFTRRMVHRLVEQ